MYKHAVLLPYLPSKWARYEFFSSKRFLRNVIIFLEHLELKGQGHAKYGKKALWGSLPYLNVPCRNFGSVKERAIEDMFNILRKFKGVKGQGHKMAKNG